MPDTCYCCGTDLALEKHHPDGKKIRYWTMDKTTGLVYDADTYEGLLDFMTKNDIQGRLYHENVHINPNNFMWLCPTDHALLKFERYNVEIISQAHIWAQSKCVRLTREMLDIHVNIYRLENQIVKLDKPPRRDAKDINQHILDKTAPLYDKLKDIIDGVGRYTIT